MIAKIRITTEEEAKAALAERRRLAREQAERAAELEKQRLVRAYQLLLVPQSEFESLLNARELRNGAPLFHGYKNLFLFFIVGLYVQIYKLRGP
jgi:hypothetical protein